MEKEDGMAKRDLTGGKQQQNGNGALDILKNTYKETSSSMSDASDDEDVHVG